MSELNAQHKLINNHIANLIKDLEKVVSKIESLSLKEQGVVTFKVNELQSALDTVETIK